MTHSQQRELEELNKRGEVLCQLRELLDQDDLQVSLADANGLGHYELVSRGDSVVGTFSNRLGSTTITVKAYKDETKFRLSIFNDRDNQTALKSLATLVGNETKSMVYIEPDGKLVRGAAKQVAGWDYLKTPVEELVQQLAERVVCAVLYASRSNGLGELCDRCLLQASCLSSQTAKPSTLQWMSIDHSLTPSQIAISVFQDGKLVKSVQGPFGGPLTIDLF